MILEALIGQFTQRFQYEKRAQVCLWFDEKKEFARLLPALRKCLFEMKSPPFILLEYDPEQQRGQIWLKHSVFADLAQLSEKQRKKRRYVFYMPLSEERLDSPDENGAHHLELLEEYKYCGTTWRIDGKKPTLFKFLRLAGVNLPENQSDQRKLADGGADAILAKYTAKFIERPQDFWSAVLTPELAQSRLVGDMDQTILDMAVSPEMTWQSLDEKALSGEFLDMVRERYGYGAAGGDPAAWIRGIVEIMALTETYIGYGEPADYPFLNRLPAQALRDHHIQLLQRWLRDSNSRPAWDRWIREVEPNINLSAWAADKHGVSFGLPHLVSLRWQKTLDAFNEAADKISALKEFFARNRERIAREAEFSKASNAPIGAWSLLGALDCFIEVCGKAESEIEKRNTAAEFALLYIQQAPLVDKQHLKLRFEAMERSMPTISKVADRAYASYVNLLNQRFFERFSGQATPDIEGIPYVTDRLEEKIWTAGGKRAVVIVDALRYDCAHAIKEMLLGQDVEIEALQAALPTVTPVGMTALLPQKGAAVSLEIKNNSIHPKLKGKDTSAVENRKSLLTEFGADCRDIEDLENTAAKPSGIKDLLVVFGHEELDNIGHGSADNLVRHVGLEVKRLVLLIHKLHQWGYPEVHLITDHGFILLDEEKLPPEVECKKEWCHVLKERFALIPAGADVPLVSFPCRWDEKVWIAVPPGLSFFKTEKSFSHGGAALQEIIIPHLISKIQTFEKRIGVEVVLPAFELMRTSAKVTLRPKSSVGAGQMALFVETGRMLAIDILRTGESGEKSSVLASGPKEARLEAQDNEINVTLFFHTALSFKKGELLELEIRDIETSEQFPPGGIKLTVGREM